MENKDQNIIKPDSQPQEGRMDPRPQSVTDIQSQAPQPTSTQTIMNQQNEPESSMNQGNVIGQMDSPQKKSNNHKRLIIISAVGLFLIIGVALGYDPIMKQLFTPEPRSIADIQEEINAQQKPFINELSDTATRFGSLTNASITFPKDWEIELRPPNASVDMAQAMAEGPLYDNQTSLITSKITVTEERNDSSNKDIDSLFQSEKPMIRDESFIIDQSSTTINGLPATTLTYKNENSLGQRTNESPNQEIIKWILIYNDDIFFTIKMVSDEKIQPTLEPLYDKVIASFSL